MDKTLPLITCNGKENSNRRGTINVGANRKTLFKSLLWWTVVVSYATRTRVAALPLEVAQLTLCCKIPSNASWRFLEMFRPISKTRFFVEGL